ncbi:hypothetical protein CALCODRAFT_520880 [Calocera cornea HHB12733]|uniref:Vacuolar sorting protein Vps3844 C-terminal domain-containing protein n=1 Tax=Calocera cornea HHB12733 TaxID=1353952 RepID=A0A165D6U4_9BASI|nr:hypothetical protein CALCODRAFT_520880 [Calocera cornea HHB12733]
MALLALLLAALIPAALATAPTTPPQPGAIVYLHPPPPHIHTRPGRPALSPSQAHAVLSYHIGLDRWIALKQSGQWIDELVRPPQAEHGDIVSAPHAGLLLLVESDSPDEILPRQEAAFTIPFSLPRATYTSLLATYAARLALLSPTAAFSTAYNASSRPPAPLLAALDMHPSPAAQRVEQGLQKLAAYADWVDAGGPTGGVVELRGLGQLKTENERAYEEARSVLDAALTVPALANHNYALLVLPATSPANPLLAQSSSSSSCYTTSQSCESSTSSCSGHGHCASTTRAGRTCYVCTCSKALALAGQTTSWAGDKCDKVDISGSFTLLLGATLFMLALAVGSVMLLWGVGEQPLPSTLFGAPPGTKRE